MFDGHSILELTARSERGDPEGDVDPEPRREPVREPEGLDTQRERPTDLPLAPCGGLRPTGELERL